MNSCVAPVTLDLGASSGRGNGGGGKAGGVAMLELTGKDTRARKRLAIGALSMVRRRAARRKWNKALSA
jgi:hypothetical protein